MGIATLAAFALPLLLVPLRWARIFRWDLPKDTRLTVYFARSLGAVAGAVSVAMIVAGSAEDPPSVMLLLAVLAGALLAAVHIVGAVERSQPWTETAEIGLWIGLTVWGLLLLLL